jgi:uncharacterized protein (TIGR02145 family)
VPTDVEWTTLTTFLGGVAVASGKLKSTGLQHWLSPNLDATNESGFSGLPAGFRYLIGTFNFIGTDGVWWSSTESSAASALYRSLSYNDGDANRNTNNKEVGFSVRCLRD